MPEGHNQTMAQAHKGALALLRWHIEMGADEAIEDGPVDRFAIAAADAVAANASPTPQPATPPTRLSDAARPVAAAVPAAFVEAAGEAAQSARLSRRALTAWRRSKRRSPGLKAAG